MGGGNEALMPKEVIKLTGFKELGAALAELPKATGKATARRVLIKAGTPIQEMAEQAAPVRSDPEKVVTYGRGDAKRIRRPGTAEALVQIGTRLTRSQARQARKAGKSETEVYVGTRDPISRLIEGGTSQIAAHPFIRPAWDALKFRALDIIAAELGAEIEKTAARLAKKLAKTQK